MTRHDEASPPPAVLVAGHFVRGEGYAVFRSRGSGSWLVMYTVGGRGRVRAPSGVDLTADPGDLILLHPRAVHDYSVPPGGRWEFFWAHFQARPEWQRWWRLPEIAPGLARVRISASATRSRVSDAFTTVQAELARSPGQDDPDLGRLLALNRLEEVMLLAAGEGSAGRPLDPRIERVLTIIRENPAAPHRVDVLAREVALSPSRLAHLFREQVGDSISNLILNLRVEEAARLLRFTSESLETIASTVGFSSSFYLSRQFRRRQGVSPRGYRRGQGR
ncbi:MAG TPA: helix-turn-helix domain-containing protein [Candidatus Dormibacteraeota bacterium]|nr:helix-turn-helix domain-containing protein [Candidatus Dormibacteraeota bacterium]